MADVKPVPISKLLDPEGDFSDGDIVKCVKGKLLKLFTANKGQGDNGPYSFQNGEIQDDNGDKIKITFSNCEQPQNARNRTITIMSKKTAHGNQGIKIADSDQYGRSLKITSSADVVYDGNVSQPEEKKQSGGGGAGPAKQTTGGRHLLEVFDDVIALHLHCDMAVRKAYNFPSDDYTPECIQAYVSSLFIESCRQGLQHDFRAQIAKPIPKNYPPPPADPKLWRDCVMPKGEHEGKPLKDVPREKILELWSHFNETGKKSPLSKCIDQAVKDLKLGPPDEADADGVLDEETEDDIPF